MTQALSGSLHLFTYKTGVLSKVAHDLRLSLDDVTVEVEGDQVSARFAVGRLRVDGVMVSGRLDPNALSASDKRKIEKTVREEILRVDRHGEPRWSGTLRSDGRARVVEGTLEMRGREQPLRVEGREDGGRVTGSFEIVPSRWGVTPYKALLGAIQLQDRVTIAFDVASG